MSPSDTLLVHDGVETDRELSIQKLLDATRQVPSVSSITVGDESFVVPVGGTPSRSSAKDVLAAFLAVGDGVPRFPFCNYIPGGPAASDVTFDNDPTALAGASYVVQPVPWRQTLAVAANPGTVIKYPDGSSDFGSIELYSSGGNVGHLDGKAYKAQHAMGQGLHFKYVGKPGPTWLGGAYDSTWYGSIGWTTPGYNPDAAAPNATQRFACFYHWTFEGTGALPVDYEWLVLTGNGSVVTNHGPTGVDYRTAVYRTFSIDGNADDTVLTFKIDGVVVKTVSTGLPAAGSPLVPVAGVRHWLNGVTWSMRYLQTSADRKIYG